jgi:hypothetical protein
MAGHRKSGNGRSPSQEGPHLILNDRGSRCWYWWLPDETAWCGYSLKLEPSFAAQHRTYIGAAGEPTKRASFQSQVGDIDFRRKPSV